MIRTLNIEQPAKSGEGDEEEPDDDFEEENLESEIETEDEEVPAELHSGGGLMVGLQPCVCRCVWRLCQAVDQRGSESLHSCQTPFQDPKDHEPPEEHAASSKAR